jgi:hypothetical protein
LESNLAARYSVYGYLHCARVLSCIALAVV